MDSKYSKIAVFADETGAPDDYYTAKSIDIYIHNELSNEWQNLKSIQLEPISASSVAQIRKETQQRMSLMGDCSIVAAKELSGIPFSVLDMAGFGIFIMDQLSQANLSGIIDDINALNQEEQIKAELLKNAAPVELEDGFYYMDLIELQKECPEISSKAALKDFLENTPFMELKLRCAHVPPWIEKTDAFEIDEIETSKKDILAVIRKKVSKH